MLMMYRGWTPLILLACCFLVLSGERIASGQDQTEIPSTKEVTGELSAETESIFDIQNLIHLNQLLTRFDINSYDPNCKLESAAPDPKQLDKECAIPSNCSEVEPLDPQNCQRYKLNKYIAEVANVTGIHPAVFQAKIHVESTFNPTALSKAGAFGLGQFTPPTAKMLTAQINREMPGKEKVKFTGNRCPKISWKLSDFCHPFNQVKGIALHFLNSFNQETSQGSVLSVLGSNPLLLFRMVVGAYNMGDALLGKIWDNRRGGLDSFIQANEGKLPLEMGQFCSFRASVGKRLVERSCPPETRCHIYKMLGLCGMDMGLVGKYVDDWQRQNDGTWVAKIPEGCRAI